MGLATLVCAPSPAPPHGDSEISFPCLCIPYLEHLSKTSIDAELGSLTVLDGLVVVEVNWGSEVAHDDFLVIGRKETKKTTAWKQRLKMMRDLEE